MGSFRGFRRALAPAALALTLAACGGGEATDPDVPLNPVEAQGDLAIVDGVFNAPALATFSVLNDLIDGAVPTTGFRMVKAATTKDRAAAAKLVAAEMRKVFPAATPGLSLDVLPAEVLGATFEYDVESGQYLETARSGAPSNGVRFMLYAINPITGQVASPLNEIGHADFIDQSGSNNAAIRVRVVGGSTTYADYALAATPTSAGGTMGIDGFVTDGTTRLDFDLNTALSATTSSVRIVTDYDLDVPSRSVGVDLNSEVELTEISEGEVAISLDDDLRFLGPNGNVRIVTHFESGATVYTSTVYVNGDVFATITLDGESLAVVGANGQPLSQDEADFLVELYWWSEIFAELFGDLTDPFASIFTPVG